MPELGIYNFYDYFYRFCEIICGLDIGMLISVFVLVDLIIAFSAIGTGLKNNDYGRIIGGAICGLIALSVTREIGEAKIGTLIIEILGGVVGVGPHIIRSSRNLFRH